MSRQQLILAGIVGLMILAGLPAFLLPGRTVTNPKPSPEESSSLELSPGDVPDTRLNLQTTTKQERKDIRHRRKVNINTADSMAIQSIPSIGGNRAEAILEYRRGGGVFHNARDLRKIEGFGEKRAKELAKHIKYGKKYYQEPTSTSGKININQADKQQLQSLTGVGGVTAERIIEYRRKNGEFSTYADIDKVSGIGMGTIDNFADEITGVDGDVASAGSSPSGSGGTVNINTAGRSELETLPGVGSVTAKAIIDYRNSNGNFSSVDDLDAVDGIGSATLEDIRPRATVN